MNVWLQSQRITGVFNSRMSNSSVGNRKHRPFQLLWAAKLRHLELRMLDLINAKGLFYPATAVWATGCRYVVLNVESNTMIDNKWVHRDGSLGWSSEHKHVQLFGITAAALGGRHAGTAQNIIMHGGYLRQHGAIACSDSAAAASPTFPGKTNRIPHQGSSKVKEVWRFCDQKAPLQRAHTTT